MTLGQFSPSGGHVRWDKVGTLCEKTGSANDPGAKLLSGKANLATMLWPMIPLSEGSSCAERAINGTRRTPLLFVHQ